MAGMTMWVSLNDLKMSIHTAASLGHFNLVHNLILQGVNVNEQINGGKTPLMLAVVCNSPETVMILLLGGANLDIVAENGQSALQMAFKLKGTHPAIVEKLVGSLQTKVTIIEELVEKFFQAGSTLYHVAFLGDIKVLEGLLKRGIGINSTGFKNRTALHVAVDTNNLNSVNWLLDNGADINAVDEDNLGALCISATNGNSDFVKLLLERGADPNVKAFDYKLTPFIAAMENSSSEQRYDECVELLFQFGAIPSQKIGDYPSVLDKALINGSYFRIDIFICYVALREMQGLGIAKTVIHCKLQEHQYAILEFQEYYEMCQINLKMEVFESITLFDLLTISENKFRIYMRNESFINAVSNFLNYSRENYESYRYYYNALGYRMMKAPGASLENKSILVVRQIFGGNYNLCYVIAKEVVGYLSKSDLENLCKAEN